MSVHRYNTRYQAKMDCFKNYQKLKDLLIATNTTTGLAQINAAIRLFEFLQTFQKWKTHSVLRKNILKKIDVFLEDEIHTRLEKALDCDNDDDMADALYTLEKTMFEARKFALE